MRCGTSWPCGLRTPGRTGAEALLYATKSAPFGTDLYTDRDLVGARELLVFEATLVVVVAVICRVGCDVKGDALAEECPRDVGSSVRIILLLSELNRA